MFALYVRVNVYQCWLYWWILIHTVSRMDLPFTCMSVIIIIIMIIVVVFIIFDLFLKHTALNFFCEMLCLFYPLAGCMDRTVWWLDKWMNEHSCTLSYILSFFYIVNFYLCTPSLIFSLSGITQFHLNTAVVIWCNFGCNGILNISYSLCAIVIIIIFGCRENCGFLHKWGVTLCLVITKKMICGWHIFCFFVVWRCFYT